MTRKSVEELKILSKLICGRCKDNKPECELTCQIHMQLNRVLQALNGR